MNSARIFLIALVLVLSSQLGSAQDLARYRVYVLESSLESVVAASGTRAADAKTLMSGQRRSSNSNVGAGRKL